MFLFVKCIELNGEYKGVKYQESKVDLKHVMHLKRELMLKRVDVLCDWVPIYKPYVIVQNYIFCIMHPSARVFPSNTMRAGNEGYVPESGNRNQE